MNKQVKPCVCKNCGLLCYDNFCPRCGQKTDTDRLTFRSMMHSFAAAIVGGENGLIHTIAQLFTHPNKLISDYIAGKRKNYFAPFPLLFLALAVCLVVLQVATIDFSGTLDNFDLNIVKDADKATVGRLLQRTRAIYAFCFRYFTLIAVLLAPFLIIGVRLCFGRDFRQQYNWAETTVMQTYLLVQIILCASIFTALACCVPNLLHAGWLLLLLCVVLLVIDTHGMGSTSIWKRIGQSLLAVLFTLTIQTTICIVILLLAYLH
ncbi:MAG: DUF3667 domain-containing protein [Paludibacteraceae bacterium]